MLSEFITYIQQQDLLRLSRDRLLLAVSGGLDSMTLLHLCRRARIEIGVAHCNFQLRGEEADQDAAFVAKTATELDLPYYETRFDTKAHAEQKGQSIQVAARQLRYTWLEEIRNREGYTHIGVAHHQNDVIETLLLNLTKGCGIRGLHGIYPKRDRLVRPLLFATRAELEAYAAGQAIAYREDSSNAETHYARNAVRHNVVPTLRALNPLLEQTFENNIQRFRDTERLYHYAIEQLHAQHCTQRDGRWWIDIKGVAQSPAPESLLYETLVPFGFKPKKIHYLYRRRAEESGAIYTSPTHQLLKDRTHWIVQPVPAPDAPQHIQLPNNLPDDDVRLPPRQRLHWAYLANPSDRVETTATQVCLDETKLTFPLYLRHWQRGDAFYPAGMGGQQKKLSKYFKDIKLHRFEKDDVWLLCTANDDIVWVVGYRADERFLAPPSSTRLWQARVQTLEE